MGNMLDKLCDRLFDYSLKPKPFCAYKLEKSPTTDGEMMEQLKTDYDRLNDEFSRIFFEKRVEIYKNRGSRRLLENFREWGEPTISYLHSLYTTFCDQNKKLLDYQSFECILECLGDENTTERRYQHFNTADNDADGLISYSDFLHMIYHFQSADRKYELRTLCNEVTEKVMLVNELPMEKQLEYGIF